MKPIEGSDVVDQLAALVNNLSFNEDPFVDAIRRTHRTLQQSIFGVMMKTIEMWGSLPEDQYDARNEYTVKMCRKIMNALADDWFGRPPVI